MAKAKKKERGSAAKAPGPGAGGKVLFVAAAAAFVLFFFYMQMIRSPEPFGMDQGLFADFGRWVPQGALPYRDIWDSKPPLILYTYPLAFLLTGGGVSGMWIFEGFFLALTCGAGFLLGRRLWGPVAGLATAILLFMGLWSAGLEGYTSRSQAEEFLALPLLLAAWWGLKGRDKSAAAFLSGLMLGVAGLFKVPALLVAAAWPLLWWSGEGLARLLRKTLLAVAGALLPWGLMALWFAMHGAFRDFVEAVFVYNRHYAALVASGVSYATTAMDLAGRLGFAVPTALLLAALGLAAAFLRRERESLWLGAWVLLALVAVLAQRQIAGYHCLLVIPALAVAGGRGAAWLAAGWREGSRQRLIAATALIALAVLAAGEGRVWYRTYRKDALMRAGAIPREAYLRSFQVGPFSPLTEERAARYLRSHCPVGERILVWGLSPGIYVLSDRRPVTRFPFHHLLLTDSPLAQSFGSLGRRRAAFMQRLAAHPPAYILVGTKDRNGFEPEDSRTQMLRFPAFRNFVTSGYELETEIDNFLLYKRKPDATSEPVAVARQALPHFHRAIR